MKLCPVMVLLAALLSAVSCASSSVRAEEYYALGAAYFELKKYDEAEKWFNRAKFYQATRNASEYHLGRIAFEKGGYEKALVYFERILARDPENVTALRAAAYACIKTEELEKAREWYRQVLELVPESYDEGFNYALVLMALGEAETAEQVLVKYNNTENPEALLLLARAQKQQGKPEAADAYTASLLKNDDAAVRAEFAGYLEEQGLAGRALEEYQLALQGAAEDKKADIQGAIDRLEGKEPASVPPESVPPDGEAGEESGSSLRDPRS
ncbi:MAG: tetratricopeptide repeat protein [Spirochaetaceae bacterium]|jgi:tetratricopeptide (TPR) repeat protein|nr:tetratricopeptide repeat protein [Spirochaetaceae bacterium]